MYWASSGSEFNIFPPDGMKDGSEKSNSKGRGFLSIAVDGLAPNYLSSKFIQRSDVITSYNLRDSDGKLAIPLPRTNYYKNSFGYSGAVL